MSTSAVSFTREERGVLEDSGVVVELGVRLLVDTRLRISAGDKPVGRGGASEGGESPNPRQPKLKLAP